MKREITEINRLLQELRSLATISDDNQKKLDRKFRLEFNYNSNHIEGNTLTYGETELLLIFDKTEGIHEMREYEEMKAHDVAYNIIQEWAADKEHPLTETYIKQLNEIILVKPFWKEAITQDGQATRRLIKVGEYKEYPNSVRLQNGEIFEYASPIGTPIKMGELMQWYNNEVEKQELHPVVVAALLHYKFVCIHPFDDGNGRLSRLLMNYVLLKNDLPPVIIKTLDKKNYLNALNKADVGDIETFIKYVAEQLIWSLQLVIKATKGESVDEMDDFEKKLSLLKKKLFKDEKITIKYSVESVKNVINDSIIPLLNYWETKLLEFDVLFYSRKCVVDFNGYIKHGVDVSSTAQELFDKILNSNNEIRNGDQKIETIKINPIFQNLRSFNNDIIFNDSFIRFKFYDNAIEIDSTQKSKAISKLYNQKLTEDEIKTIVSDLGNFLYNQIEKYLEENNQ